MRAACQAGAVPKSTPETTESATVNSSTGTFSSITVSDGSMNCGISATTARITRNASPMPTAPPTSASTRLSVRSCRAISTRDAPSAVRTVTSRCRAVPRARSRLATLAQAMSSRKPTAASSSHSEFFVAGLRKLLRNGSTLGVQPRLESGNSAACRSATSFSRALACSTVTPGFSRPSAVRKRAPRSAATASG